jgi:hypothetical protein
MKIFEWALKYLESKGRKYAFVDYFGDVLFYRYYVFFYEDHIDNRYIAKLPNLYIHIYPGDSDGTGPNPEGSHTHPWSTLGFILKGGYKEVMGDTYERITKKFQFAFTSHKQRHRITECEPGTTTLFFHWFKQHKWEAHLQTCKVVCDTCNTLNNGVCNKETRTLELDEHIKVSNISVEEDKPWRSVTFLKVDSKFDATISRRKRALAKLYINAPKTINEKTHFMKLAQIKKRNESNT